MSSHNTEAAYASAEIAGYLQDHQETFFGSREEHGEWSLFAGSEGGSQWPLADGVISARASNATIQIAFEFKRSNEGVHGILTALGQSFAYLEKGYNASIMAFPARYSSHQRPGEHIKNILELTSPEIPIWIFTYDDPDLSATRPFMNKLTCVRSNNYFSCRQIGGSVRVLSGNRVTTMWAHVREGMSHPDAYYKYCKCVKIITANGENYSEYHLPEELIDAIHRIDSDADVFQYLSNTSSDTILDKAWRRDWFNYYFTEQLAPIYRIDTQGQYVVNDSYTDLLLRPGTYQNLFFGRRDSIKNILVNKLNSGEITVNDAWEEYAKKVRKVAHSYREVIDSGLNHIGYLNPDGELTELGYKYVDACDRYNSAYESLPMNILRSSFLQNGKYAALLHYIYKLSEDKFDEDLYSFTNERGEFDSNLYRTWLFDNFKNDLHLVQTSSLRAGGTRHPLQSEIWLLNKLGMVRSAPNGRVLYRMGTGLCIDWPQVETSLQFFYTL